MPYIFSKTQALFFENFVCVYKVFGLLSSPSSLVPHPKLLLTLLLYKALFHIHVFCLDQLSLTMTVCMPMDLELSIGTWWTHLWVHI